MNDLMDLFMLLGYLVIVGVVATVGIFLVEYSIVLAKRRKDHET